MENHQAYAVIEAEGVFFRVEQLPYYIGSASFCQLQISSVAPVVLALVFNHDLQEFEIVANDDIEVDGIDFLHGCLNIPLTDAQSEVKYQNLRFVVRVYEMPEPDEGDAIGYFRQRNFCEL